MITPVNGHILIEPIAHDTFMAQQTSRYEEIGLIVAVNDDTDYGDDWTPEVGERVYFDAWLAAKYPKRDGKEGEYYWLVNWKDVRAAEEVEEDGTFNELGEVPE